MNIASILARPGAAHPDTVAVAVGATGVWTYRAFAAGVARLAHALRSRSGLAPGARVALAMRNCPEFLLVLFAAWHAGLAAVPLNFRLHRQEFRYIVDNAGVELLFVTPDLASTLAGLDDEVETLRSIVCTEDESFAELVGGADAMPCAETRPDDPAWIFYTSGTTGRPKGATLTHRNLAFMTQAYYADVDAIAPGDAMLHPAALSHGAGLYSLPSIAQGGRQVICEEASFDPGEVLRLVAAHRNVSLFGAPTMLKRLTLATEAADADTSNLRTFVYGGGPAYVEDLRAALATFGTKLVQIFGQGETPMTITALARDDHRDEVLHTCGVARTLVDVRVVDDGDREVPAGELGEIVTRSDCVMRGYWGNREATAETLRGGWLHTGDLGSMDEYGYLTLKDRAKDLVISGGSNIYPREIEEVILRHARVLEVSVIGRPHPDWGEEPVAFVVARPGLVVEAAELDRLCLDSIARYKRPRAYYFVDSLPKNNYGKVLKTSLRERLRDPNAASGAVRVSEKPDRSGA
ncbi:MAG TPA: AMP-binding protein [Casimicrobiaceae bacterium]|nr:AMP-binding protein [Casimicrobiaceae bacterium]